MTIIAATGKPTIKKIDGRAAEVTPFCGSTGPGEYASYGVGFFTSPSGGQIWGLVMPQMPVRSWCAMKLLEQLPEIHFGTLCACWYVAAHDIHPNDLRYLNDLAEMFPNRAALDAVRAEVLAQTPTDDEITSMLTNLKEGGAQVESFELVSLVQSGIISPNPLIDELVAAEKARQRQREDYEEFVKAPVPPQVSLSRFFTDLTMNNLLSDWGEGPVPIKTQNLDEEAKRASTGKYAYALPLQREGKDGRTVRPSIKAQDGKVYTFLTAAYPVDTFVIETTVDTPGEDPVTKKFTIQELRELGLTQPPPPPVQKRGWRIPGLKK